MVDDPDVPFPILYLVVAWIVDHLHLLLNHRPPSPPNPFQPLWNLNMLSTVQRDDRKIAAAAGQDDSGSEFEEPVTDESQSKDGYEPDTDDGGRDVAQGPQNEVADPPLAKD